jgi:endonuclease G
MPKTDLEQLKGILEQVDKETLKKAVEDLGLLDEVLLEPSTRYPITRYYKDLPQEFAAGQETQPGPGDPCHCTLEELKEISPFEVLVGPHAEFLPAHFLEEGAKVQKAVTRVVVPGVGFGTGFLVSPSLLITNNHVLPREEVARRARFEFNYQLNFDGNPEQMDTYSMAPNGAFHTNPTLDYTIVQLAPSSSAGPPGRRWEYLRLRVRKMAEGQRCNIIQHPRARYKEVALHDNKITNIYTNVIRYRTDTEPGSSGSPVFDNEWELIAVHHARGDEDPQNRNVWLNNEGIRLDKIIADLQNHYRGKPGGQAILRELGIFSGVEDGGTTSPPVSPVNINTADRNMFLAIPGMDARRADALIGYRDQHGAFTSVWDLALLDEFPIWLVTRLLPHLTI